MDTLTPMAELASRWGITANTVSRRLAFLGIKPERQGNLRYITAEQLALGDDLQSHIGASAVARISECQSLQLWRCLVVSTAEI